MAPERIRALDICNRELFTAIYGINGSGEVYMTDDLRINNMRETLYLYLKQEGYIPVFYDDKAFSYEEEPLLKFFSYTARKPAPQDVPSRRDFFKGKGPMSGTRNMDSVSSPSAVEANVSHHDSVEVEAFGNQRRFIVRQGEGFFHNVFSYVERNPETKLALVFVTPSTFTMDEDQRKVFLNRWNDLRDNFRRNRLAVRVIVLYDYPSPKIFAESLDKAADELFLLSPFKDLILLDIGGEDDGGSLHRGLRGKTVFFLGGPGRDEIANMLNRRRLLSEGGLPHLFTNVAWDHIVLRLWQGSTVEGGRELSLISDYLGAPELDSIIERMDTVKAIDRLNAMEGIDNIRKQFASYREALAEHLAGRGSGRFRPHMALMGSPGTGKSTVARLFGDILREDGLLPKGHFIKVSTDELVGEYVGETRPKTRAVCERARGGVLFIDEAYGLMSGSGRHGNVDYGKEAIEVLIQFMEDSSDSLVILAGYTDEIMTLINEGNKGFRRRFNDLGLFEFMDYSPEVLYNISSRMIREPATDAFRKALRGIIRYKCAYKNKKFGNVGDMENLVSLIVSRYHAIGTDAPLDVEHLPDDLRRLVDDSVLDAGVLLSDLDDVIGQDRVKDLVRKIFNKVVADRKKLMVLDDFRPKMPKLNFLFTGNPGTGKTTIARIVGGILLKLGIFPSSQGNILTEVSGSELLQYTPDDIRKLFEDNIGKVLFIDEAYQLRDSPRVIADIVGNLELEEYKNKLSVIMAGYTDDIHRLYNINPGLKRRFAEIPFADYSDEELYEILQRMAASADHTVMDAEACRENALRCFRSVPRDRNFGNAGIAENLLEILAQNRDLRYNTGTPEQQQDQDFIERILPCDFPDDISDCMTNVY